jgi:tight adherence protein C
VTPLLAFVDAKDALPLVVAVGFSAGVFWLLNALSQRNSRAEERLDRIGRPRSLAELDLAQADKGNRFAGLKDAFSKLGERMEPTNELERNTTRARLANAGFRSENAPVVFQGIKLAAIVGGLALSAALYFALGLDGIVNTLAVCVPAVVGLMGPNFVLNSMIKQRQQEIFVTLPDALDLLVVCVESGLGLDAGMRKVTEELKDSAKVMCEELTLANLQLQMGRPRREVLHDLGVRTGVDDVKALAAILIQADRFGSSIAQALRVQSDSMRTRRRQIAEEKAAATSVKLIFPLVLFIFPAIFVVLCGPAAIQIQKNLLSK